VLALLLAGNLFCFACPFMLPRRLAKRLLPASRAWPRWLPGKWVAVGVLILFFWAYEAFALWSSPLLTAWVALAYFAAAFVIDGFFKGAAFCKHVCPIGQFHFVHAMTSPLEVAVRDPQTCLTCTTKDCIAGRAGPDGRITQNGCELWLFPQRKVGNLDCTFCLDCVHACPHDNVGVLRHSRAREFALDRPRSGIGRLTQRTDLAALALVLVFGAFLNAFGMVEPVYRLESWLADLLGLTARPAILAVLFVVVLGLVPLGLLALAALATRRLARDRGSLVGTAVRFSYALIPIGFGMWLAHYGFHFLVGALTIVPVTQSFVADLGLPILGTPRWDLAALVPAAWTDPIEAAFLLGGLLGSLAAVRRVAADHYRGRRTQRAAALPWIVLCFLLVAVGLWLMSLPMEMRGTMLAG
ncbi:MAG: FesM, partial [Sphaerobacter sp.]|nr:FesM [Sphaerobacter sp.]